MAARLSTTALVALVLASTACQAEHAHVERVTLALIELRASEPRVIRWQLCKEGLGTGEAINAELELEVERRGDAAVDVEVRRWSSASAFEAGEDAVPFPAEDVVRSGGEIRVSLRPEGPFTLDGRRCTDDQFVELEGRDVIVRPSIEARVLDWGQVIDRLVLDAELLS